MEGAARLVAKFAVARELGAAAPGRPCLAGGEQGACVPATAEGFFASAMTSISGERVRSTPSRVMIVSPGLALRTTILPPSTYL